MRLMSVARVFLVMLLVASVGGGCVELEPKPGKFECEDHSDCPSGWYCAVDLHCYPKGSDAGSLGCDAGATKKVACDTVFENEATDTKVDEVVEEESDTQVSSDTMDSVASNTDTLTPPTVDTEENDAGEMGTDTKLPATDGTDATDTEFDAGNEDDAGLDAGSVGDGGLDAGPDSSVV